MHSEENDFDNTNDHARIRKEMQQLRAELAKSLKEFLESKEIKSKLKPDEREALKKEFSDLDELLRQLETGLIHLALFGITSAGKSSIINSLMGKDIATVGPEHGVTVIEKEYKKEPWCLVDVPGILDNKVNDDRALSEAKRSIGHIFVVEREPYGPEIQLFDLVYEHFRDSPRIVFVNKWDVQLNRPKADREIVKEMIIKKMRKYVEDADKDIIFGSAALYDAELDKMIRQPLPQLEDRLYHDSGTLGEIVNIIDPTNRASSLISEVKKKILEIRKRVARRINVAFATTAIAASVVPFDSLIVAPVLFVSQFFAVCKIMGAELGERNTERDTMNILKVCIAYLTTDFVAVSVAEGFFSFIPIIGTALDLAFLSFFKYKRTMIFGEIAIAYIENDFSFGDNIKQTLLEAKQRAEAQMKFFKKQKPD